MTKAQLRKQKERVIKRWHDRQARYEFVRRRLKKILELSMEGWPRMTRNPDYLKWLDLVYEIKGRGIYGLKNSTCDVIARLRHMAEDLQRNHPKTRRPCPRS